MTIICFHDLTLLYNMPCQIYETDYPDNNYMEKKSWTSAPTLTELYLFKYRKGNTNKKYLMAVWTLSGPWYLEDMKNLVHQEQQSVFTRHHGGHIGVPKQ